MIKKRAKYAVFVYDKTEPNWFQKKFLGISKPRDTAFQVGLFDTKEEAEFEIAEMGSQRALDGPVNIRDKYRGVVWGFFIKKYIY